MLDLFYKLGTHVKIRKATSARYVEVGLMSGRAPNVASVGNGIPMRTYIGILAVTATMKYVGHAIKRTLTHVLLVESLVVRVQGY